MTYKEKMEKNIDTAKRAVSSMERFLCEIEGSAWNNEIVNKEEQKFVTFKVTDMNFTFIIREDALTVTNKLML